MTDQLAEIEREFGMTMAAAAAQAGAAGMASRIPAGDIYDVVVDAALLFAATMSQSRMTEPEFMCLCRMHFDGVRQKRKTQSSRQREQENANK